MEKRAGRRKRGVEQSWNRAADWLRPALCGGALQAPPAGSGAEPPEHLKFGATWDLKIHYRNAL